MYVLFTFTLDDEAVDTWLYILAENTHLKKLSK